MRIMSATRPLQVLASCQETFTTGAREHEQHPWCRAVCWRSQHGCGVAEPLFSPRGAELGSPCTLPSEPGKKKDKSSWTKVDRAG